MPPQRLCLVVGWAPNLTCRIPETDNRCVENTPKADIHPNNAAEPVGSLVPPWLLSVPGMAYFMLRKPRVWPKRRHAQRRPKNKGFAILRMSGSAAAGAYRLMAAQSTQTGNEE